MTKDVSQSLLFLAREHGALVEFALDDLQGVDRDARVERRSSSCSRQDLTLDEGAHRFDDLRERLIDGREAWTWYERPANGRKLVAIVPYDDVTYTIEYSTQQEDRFDEDEMRVAVESFARTGVPPSAALIPWIGGLLALIIGFLILRLRGARQDPNA